MSPRATAAALVDAASAPYWSTDLFAYYRARGKLRGDPAFTGILKEGLLAESERILDLGCGQGLLAAWLLAARSRSDERPRNWPSEWPAAPRPTSIRGIELRQQDVQRARDALGQKAQFDVGDITQAEFGTVDAIVILDVLHYIDHESQLCVLNRAHAALTPGGVLLLRVSDAGSGIRFTIGKYIDQTVMLTHYRRAPRFHYRTMREWLEVLAAAGFHCEAIPMSAGTPFANTLLIARPRKPARASRPSGLPDRAMTELLLKEYTATSCIGRGRPAMLEALRGQRGGLAPCTFETAAIDTWTGEVSGIDAERLPAALKQFDCRNNRLAQLGLRQDGFADAVAQSVGRWGRRRIGVFLGTSTSGILQTELAYRHRDPVTGALPDDFDYAGSQNAFSVADFVRRALGLEGPAIVVCSACSSSAKVFGSARRMMDADLIDAAVVGGVDSLCLTTLYGFHALQLTSRGPCKPFDAARDGISISEAAAFALLERVPDSLDADAVTLIGVGESSDAYHMSSPQPEGLGARAAMLAALDAAGLDPGDIDYINLHGTGTLSNDSAESRAVAAVFGDATAGSSTKGATGHALGAAGALEAVICSIALQNGFAPAGINTKTVDPALGIRYLVENRPGRLARVLSNSFGFGGTNCSLVLGRAG